MYEKGAKYRKSKELRQNMFNSETGEKGRGAVTDFDYTIPEVEMEGFLGAARWFGIRGQRLDMTAGMRRQIFPLTRGMDQMPDTAAFMNNPNAPRAGEERNREYRKAYLQDQKRRLDYFKRLKIHYVMHNPFLLLYLLNLYFLKILYLIHLIYLHNLNLKYHKHL